MRYGAKTTFGDKTQVSSVAKWLNFFSTHEHTLCRTFGGEPVFRFHYLEEGRSRRLRKIGKVVAVGSGFDQFHRGVNSMLVIIIFLNAGLLSATGSNTTKTSSQELELIICQQKNGFRVESLQTLRKLVDDWC